MRIFRPRRRRGRLAFAATALLAGCSTATPRNMAQSTPWALGADTQSSVVMLRVVPGAPDAAPRAARDLLSEAQAWDIERGFVSAANATPLVTPTGQPSPSTGAAGWIAVARAPGRHFVRLRAAPDAPPQDFIVTVPAGRSAVYAGTFRRDCAGDAPSSCRLVPTAGDEAAARDAVPDAQRAAFPFVAAAAQPYPPRLAGTNLPPPVAPAIRADPVAWLSAVDWLGILDDRAASVARPAGDYTSGNLDPFGLAAALVLMVPIGLVVLAIQAQQRRSQQIAADDALTRAQALRARAEAVRTAWSPCEATIGDALAPDRVVERLAAAFPASRRATAAANPWQATVTRVALRHCGQGSDTFGVEVATRWTAPGYDASFVRPVQGATPDNRLRWSTPPPWEVQVAPAGACRPLAEWCAAGGRALLDDVTQSVLGARDAIAATR